MSRYVVVILIYNRHICSSHFIKNSHDYKLRPITYPVSQAEDSNEKRIQERCKCKVTISMLPLYVAVIAVAAVLNM
jgi:hypothetical protein